MAVKSFAETVDRVRPAPRGVTVLIYHRVGGASGLELDLPASRFEEQMDALAQTGRACTLERALDQLAGRPPEGPDPVVVTFDDGTADFTDVAVPLLVRYGIPAILYVATDFVERGAPFPYGAPPASWAALHDALSTGLVDIGSHTHTHRLLDRLAPAEVVDELDRSAGLIGERLGVVAEHFAYPKAVEPTAPAAAAVRQRYRSAALAGTRPNRYGATDPWRLARSPIQAADGMRWFHRKVAGGMAVEDGLRRFANRARYARSAT